MSLRLTCLAVAVAAPALAFQSTLPRMDIDEAFLRGAAYLYPVPEYPPASIQANHTGRVAVEVTVAPDGNNFTYARVQSAKVLEAPDPDLAKAVLAALDKARFTPMGDRQGIHEAVGRVIWDFRITDGKPEVISMPLRSVHPPRPRPVLSADDLRIVQRARQILVSESVWSRADTRECPADLKVFSLYCALEKATKDITGGFDHRGIVMEAARAAIDEVAPKADYEHRLMGYNNDPTITFADIQNILRLTERHIATRLQSEK